MARLGTDHATRLWLAVQLQAGLDRPRDGWVKLRPQLLNQIGLPPHSRNVVARLERLGLIEVQRSPGKRASARLTCDRRPAS